jgi:hypothetical protein
MHITAENVVPVLNDVVTELTMVLVRLREIEQDTPDTHDEILQLNGRAVPAMDLIADVITFIGEHKPPPELIGGRLKNAMELFQEILVEKTRIVKATPKTIYHTNDFTSKN